MSHFLQHLGKWFVITDFVSSHEDHNGTDLITPCDHIQISRADNVTVTVTSYNDKNIHTTIESDQSVPGVGKFEMLKRNIFDHDNSTLSIPLWIIDTDYKNYSVWSYCNNVTEGLYIGEYLYYN